jgi:hypothetical protein
MNFVELVRLNNQLSDLTMTDLQEIVANRFDLIIQRTDVPLANIDQSLIQNLTDKNVSLQQNFKSFEHELQCLKNKVQEQIQIEGHNWLKNSSFKYEKELESKFFQKFEALGLHRNKPTVLDPDLLQMFKTRVGSYCDWHHPAMIIHPMLEPFINDMIGSDPLYLIDESHHLLEPTLAQFNTVYKNRLRPYVIEESFDWPILHQLPNDQFGFCLAYNYLNYRPFELIKKYLEEIYQKLKPGGVLAMTYFDCDRYQALQMVEQNITCYTPGSLIRAWAKYLGYEEIYCHADDEGARVWLEIKRPGTLTSLRGGQSLAKIMPKPIAESK